jgi:hypothetical protein
VIGAAIVALTLDLALVMAWPDLVTGSRGFAAAQLVGFAGGVFVLAMVAVGSGARLPWRDIALAGLAAAAMAGALWPMRVLTPSAATLALQVAAGGLVYAALAIALNIAGARSLLAAALARIRLPGQASKATSV